MNTVQLKHSIANATVPALAAGEVATTEADPGKLFVGQSTGVNDVVTGVTSAQATKLAGVAANAEVNRTPAELVSAINGVNNANVFTDAEKAKLAGVDDNHYKGEHLSLGALNIAQPAASAGDYADVDAAAGSEIQRYIWDVNDAEWVAQSGAVGGETNASIKTKYEANADTNAYLDSEKAKLAGVEDNATADQTGAEMVTAINAEADANIMTDAQAAKLLALPTTHTHLALTDTPAAFTANGFLMVNPAGDGVIHVDTIDGGTF